MDFLLKSPSITSIVQLFTKQHFKPVKIESNCSQDKCKQKTEFVLERQENIVGKRENAAYQHFLLFP